jgi:hypothetical protein
MRPVRGCRFAIDAAINGRWSRLGWESSPSKARRRRSWMYSGPVTCRAWSPSTRARNSEGRVPSRGPSSRTLSGAPAAARRRRRATALRTARATTCRRSGRAAGRTGPPRRLLVRDPEPTLALGTRLGLFRGRRLVPPGDHVLPRKSRVRPVRIRPASPRRCGGRSRIRDQSSSASRLSVRAPTGPTCPSTARDPAGTGARSG